MKTRPWHYLVEFHHHDNTECTQLRPKPGLALMKLWGTGDKPRCEECGQLDAISRGGEQARGSAAES